MKKKIYLAITVLLVMTSITTATVWAKTLHTDWISQKISKGYSEKDAYSIMAIMALSKENVSAYVEQKYKEFSDWDKVAEYYNINITDFHMFIEQQEQAAKDLEIPDEIYEEMSESGMTDDECKQLAKSAFTAQIDIKSAWEAKKDGKTVMDLVQEETKLKNEQGQTAADLTFGLISDKEYIEKMQSLSPEMAMSDILTFATTERRGWREFRKAASGITDAEIAAAEKMGMTDFFAICRLKDAEKLSEKTYNEMLVEVKNGIAIDEVIKDNMSQSKVNAVQSKSNIESE